MARRRFLTCLACGLMISRLAIAAVFALSLLAGAARAQAPDPNMWMTMGAVYAIAAAGNTVYVGGSFGVVGPNTGHFVGIDVGTGLPKPGWPRVNGTIYCSTADGVGGCSPLCQRG